MRPPRLTWIQPGDAPQTFPHPALAWRDPDGLLAMGGDLSPARLLYAYRHGIFPWYHGDQPILWWSPDPRAVLRPAEFHASRSLRKRLRQGGFTLRYDTAFADVMAACAGRRPQQLEGGTWITPEMQAAYEKLHGLGHAHSVEIWQDGELAGGLYGVVVGTVFFGESMFSRRPDGSKIALACLCRQLQAWDFGLIDCQVSSTHLTSLGAVNVPRPAFLGLLDRYCEQHRSAGDWRKLNGQDP